MSTAKKSKLSTFDLFMLLICALMWPDTIASNAVPGVSSITWWVILLVLYLLPQGFIMGELSSAYPENGGMIVWVREGLGSKWAHRTNWLYYFGGWFSVSSNLLLANVLCEMFSPGASYWTRIYITIITLWIQAWLTWKPMSESKLLVNIAGVVKLLFYFLIFSVGIISVFSGNIPANDFSTSTLMPKLDEGMVFVPILLFSCFGLEIASSSAQEFDNPTKALPTIIVLIAVSVAALNIISSIGILLIIPRGDLDILNGAMDVFMKAFNTESRFLFYIFGIALAFCIFLERLVCSLGAARGAARTAKSGELPSILAKETSSGMPVGAIIATTIGRSAVLIIYGFFAGGSAASLFMTLLGFRVFTLLIPKLYMTISYQVLRKGKLKGHAGYKAPMGTACAWASNFIHVATAVLLVYTPGSGLSSTAGSKIVGLLVVIGIGEIVMWLQRKKWQAE